MSTEIEKMRQINIEQKEYYEKASGGEESDFNNNATNFYRRFRKRAFRALQKEKVSSSINNLHIDWMGDVSTMKILDLGLGEGNPHSLKLAREANEYVGVDLSTTRIADYKKKLEDNNIFNAKALAVDFLSQEFQEHNFDLVYAMAVFHHFEHIESFLKVLHGKMNPNGFVVTLDPLETWFPAKLVRLMYRPFQKDADWEFPFTSKTLQVIQKYFVIEEIQGMYGKSKWAIPISIFSLSKAKDKASKWHDYDFLNANTLEKSKTCLQVSMKLRRR